MISEVKFLYKIISHFMKCLFKSCSHFYWMSVFFFLICERIHCINNVNLHNKSSKVTEWKVSFFFFFTLLFSWLAEYFFDWSSWRDGLSCLLNSWSAKKWLVAEYAGWPLCPVTGRLSARASWFSSFWPLIYTCRLFWLNSQGGLKRASTERACLHDTSTF